MAAVELTEEEVRTRRTPGWPLVVAAGAGALVATVATLAFTATADSGIEIGDTFTAEVENYFGPEGPEPNVICFDREVNCGVPILASEDMTVEAGQTVTVTEVLLDSVGSETRVAFFVHAPDQE